jgi:terminase small subunit / prophage DNA-packing protein
MTDPLPDQRSTGSIDDPVEDNPLPDEVSAPTLAHLLGVSEREVRNLAKAGIAVRAGRGRYRLQESVRHAFEHIRRTASQRGGEASLEAMRAERIRIAKEQADALGLKNAAARGEMRDANDVRREWSDILRAVRAGMLAVPSRAGARLPHLTPHDIAEIDAEVRAVLTEIGKEDRA